MGNAYCLMMVLGVIFSGVGTILLVMAFFNFRCPDVKNQSDQQWVNKACKTLCPYEVSPMPDALAALCAFHVMALLWCVASSVLFGVGLCARKCAKNKGFMIGLVVCCGCFSLMAMIAWIIPPATDPGVISDEKCYELAKLLSGLAAANAYFGCVNNTIRFILLFLAWLNSGACVVFAIVACCVGGK